MNTLFGVTLTPSLSFSKHLKNKSIAATISMNYVWCSLFSEIKVSLKTKLHVFGLVMRLPSVDSKTMFKQKVKYPAAPGDQSYSGIGIFAQAAPAAYCQGG